MKTFVIAAAALFAAPMLAHAQPLASDQPTAVAVRYQDLDLNRRADAHVVLGRISDAALEACGASSFSLPDYRASVQRSDCFRRGVQQAVAAINAPEVTNIYNRHALVEVGANASTEAAGD